MVHASLFSGIGGFDLAARIVGWENAFSCEIDPFCNRVLKFHFPDETKYNDIRRTDFSVWRGRIDVLSGGFPCQPFSQAGKRKGTDDDRHLWPAMLTAIWQIRPRWVVGENVLGIVNWNAGMVFEQVCADLEAEGYQVQPFVLPASGVDAPHRRYRTFFIAYADSRDDLRESGEHERKDGKKGISDRDYIRKPDEPDSLREYPGVGVCEDDTHSYGTRLQKPWAEQPPAGTVGIRAEASAYSERGGGDEMGTHLQSEESDGQGLIGIGREQYASHSDGDRNQPCGTHQEAEGERRPNDGQSEERRIAPKWTHGLSYVSRATSDTGCMPGRSICGQESGEQKTLEIDSDAGIRSWWTDFPTVAPVCRGDDGFSDWLDPAAVFERITPSKRAIPFNRWRSESVKAYGNAVVVPLIVQIFRAIDLFGMQNGDTKQARI